MSLPTVFKTWVISPNNRIAFVSLIDTMGKYLFGVKAFLKTNGYTVKGSCDGTTGSMDSTDRWASGANVATRATIAGAAQSWVVLTDGNGCDILLTYQGASDDIARISFSPGGLMVAAGTPAQQPTATDEQVIASATSLILATASADRLWNGWVSSDRKNCRFAIARSAAWVGITWGVEAVQSTVVTAVFNPPVWGFAFTPANLAGTLAGLYGGYVASTRGGLAKTVVSSVAFSCQCYIGSEMYNATPTTFGNTKTELQGAVGYPMFPLAIGSNTAGASGKVGNLLDWWLGRTATADADVYGALQFIVVGTAGGVVWPWDGITSPVLT